jgi:hypothetical protein
MRIKFIVIICNLLIVFFLAVIALTPFAIFGPELAADFFRAAWPLALLLILAMAGLNVFFLLNHRLFLLLEREDWPALVEYLERRVLRRGRYSPRLTRLLANSCLVMGDMAGVLRLENKVAIARPVLLEENALLFGAARLLGGDPAGAAVFFRTRLEKAAAKRRSPDALWLRWYYGFSQFLAGAADRAEAEFWELAAAADPLVAGLSAYFLAGPLPRFSARPAECRARAGEGREQVRQSLKTIAGWNRTAAKIETEVYAAIIKKYINEAGAWLFPAAAEKEAV